MISIDVNCDMGRGFANDADIMPFISSANIACGYHAGDKDTMRRTVELALQHQVAIEHIHLTPTGKILVALICWKKNCKRRRCQVLSLTKFACCRKFAMKWGSAASCKNHMVLYLQQGCPRPCSRCTDL